MLARPLETVASLFLHGALIVVVARTEPKPPPVSPSPRDTSIIWVEPTPAVPPLRIDPPEPGSGRTTDEPSENDLVTSQVPVGFHDVVADEDIVPDPLPGTSDHGFSPADFMRPVGDGPDGHGLAGGDGMPFAAREVDQPVAPRLMPEPVYPPALRDAGIAGTVVATFVVDTTGRVEPGSVRILEASHEAFSDAVRRALANATFHPARAAGRPVRQLVRQRFSFEAGRGMRDEGRAMRK